MFFHPLLSTIESITKEDDVSEVEVLSDTNNSTNEEGLEDSQHEQHMEKKVHHEQF